MRDPAAPLANGVSATTSFARIRQLTTAYLIATAATLGCIVLARNDRALVDADVWAHAIIVFGFALLLAGVAERAARGARRAYLRLRIISIVIPVVSVVLVVIPGLFPAWMRVEQAAYAVLLLAVAWLAHRVPARSLFRAEA